jgi:hypothetical protein
MTNPKLALLPFLTGAYITVARKNISLMKTPRKIDTAMSSISGVTPPSND